MQDEVSRPKTEKPFGKGKRKLFPNDGEENDLIDDKLFEGDVNRNEKRKKISLKSSSGSDSEQHIPNEESGESPKYSSFDSFRVDLDPTLSELPQDLDSEFKFNSNGVFSSPAIKEVLSIKRDGRIHSTSSTPILALSSPSFSENESQGSSTSSKSELNEINFGSPEDDSPNVFGPNSKKMKPNSEKNDSPFMQLETQPKFLQVSKQGEKKQTNLPKPFPPPNDTPSNEYRAPVSPRKMTVSPRNFIKPQSPTPTDSMFSRNFEVNDKDKIGFGSYGDVLKHDHELDQQTYAIKKVDIRKCTNSKNREIISMAKLKPHPNIVRYHSSWKDNSYIFIQMEYCNGGTLAAPKKHKVLTEEDLLIVLFQVSQGLHHIHSSKMAHLDMKPDNIFIHEEEDKTLLYKIGDFGMCRSFPASNIEEGDSRYLAPEMLTLGKDDQEVDLPKALDYKIPNSGVRQLDKIPDFPSSFSQDFVNLVQSMLENNPILRPNARQIIDHPLVSKFDARQNRFESKLNHVEEMLAKLIDK